MILPRSVRLLPSAWIVTLVCASVALADDGDGLVAPTSDGFADTRVLPEVQVTGSSNDPPSADVDSPAARYSVSADELKSISVVTVEDALKFAPNLHVRKRFTGDNNAIVSVRGTSSRQSARTLVYADGLLLSNLLGSDFGFPPRWSMVSAEEIERVDVLYGPYSARYPGNSLGATILLATVMPETFQASASAQYFSQSYDRYGNRQSPDGHHETAFVGDRIGAWSWLFDLDRLDNRSQPLSYYTALRSGVAATAGDIVVTGGVPYRDQFGRDGYLFGINSEGLTRNVDDQARVKIAYDITPTLQGALTVVDFKQDGSNEVGSFLRDAAGQPVTSGNVAIDGNRYVIPAAAFASGSGESERRLYGLSLRSRPDAGWNWSVDASRFQTLRDIARTGAVAGDGPGTIAFGDGTGWRTIDAQATHVPAQTDGSHAIAVGVHGDLYELDNRVFDGSDWRHGVVTTFNNAFAGRTRTDAVFMQDTWAFAPGWSLMPGLRYERWQASDGVRSQGAVSIGYPKRSETHASPKLSLGHDLGLGWSARLSLARAYRFPTVSELYQGRITGNVLVNNDPDLRPENALTRDLTVEHVSDGGARLRVSVFQDDVRDALFSQTNTTVFPTVTNVQNVDRVRTRGTEIAWNATDVVVQGFDLDASVARNRATTLRNDNFPASVGKNFYRIPDWRADVVGTWHARPWLTASLAARYSGRQYNTLDNSDINPRTFGGTSRYLVVDAKLGFALGEQFDFAVGVDNATDEDYYVFHPYPGRTWYAEAKWRY